MAVYSLCFTPTRNLTMEDCHKSDTLNAGMLEQVLSDLCDWHDVPGKDINRVLTYIGLEFGHVLVDVSSDLGEICYCGVQL